MSQPQPSTTQSHSHSPVLLDEAIDALKLKANGIYVDGTFGRGGHSRAILQQLGPHGRLIAFDKDWDAVQYARASLGEDKRFSIEQGSFATLESCCAKQQVLGKVDGIFLDLGVSSPQLDNARRGFSFLHAGPLDMRMDRQQPLTAEKWVNAAEESELASAFKKYGEERFAKRIAGAIVEQRQQQAITDTRQLAEIVAAAHPAWEKHKHPATRVFQAIRIVVNRELEELETCLSQVLTVLNEGGRLVVISFHSLEDRIVKQFIQQQASIDAGPEGLPIPTAHLRARMKKIGKLIRPTEQESERNPRARSARMRVVEKIK